MRSFRPEFWDVPPQVLGRSAPTPHIQWRRHGEARQGTFPACRVDRHTVGQKKWCDSRAPRRRYSFGGGAPGNFDKLAGGAPIDFFRRRRRQLNSGSGVRRRGSQE